VKPSISHTNSKWPDKLKKLLKSAGKRQVAAGLPRGAAGTIATPYDSGASVLQIAIWNNYGAHVVAKNKKALAIPNGKGGVILVKSVHIPPRPFMQQSVGPVKRGASEITDQLAKEIRKSKQGLTPEQIDDILKALGNMARDTIRDTIVRGNFHPNSPLTIANKGSSTPLTNHGLLAKSISFDIREKKQ
jgi:uncharacterized protein with beta-barrel porin domain